MLNGFFVAVISAALVAVPVAPVRTPDARTVRATIALVTQLPQDGGRALLIVRATGDGVILLRQHDASVTDLAAALAVLDQLRRTETQPLARERQVVVQSATGDEAIPNGARQRLAAQLARLRRAPPRDVPGVGVVPAIDLRLGPVARQ
jgi:hypothetical protein